MAPSGSITSYFLQGESPKVLVVDDEPTLRAALVHLLKAEGFTCREAGSGVEALDVLEREQVPLVISDLRMPQMDGFTLLKEITRRWKRTGVMVVTASTEVDSAVACLNEGALDYVVKPFQLEEVRARVRQALEKRSMKVTLEQHRDELERRVVDLALGNFQSWADMLEERDLYLRGHSLRVSQYTAAIGRELRMGEDTIAIMTLGSRLHDIGKIGVREEFLHKPGRLTAEEYQDIMQHPVIGARLIGPYLAKWPTALAIIRSHHERLDGKGLPDGLRGEALPLPVRVVTVADSLDAMTSPRPYRPSLPVERALQELASCKGNQFDPDAVDAFFRAFPRAGVLPIATPVFEAVPLPPHEPVELPHE